MASQAVENGASVEFKEIPLSSSIPRATVPKQKKNRIWFLCGIIGALVLAVLVLAIFSGILFFTSRFQINSPDNRKFVDHTLGEIRAAYQLRLSMNLSVDPCDDFYDYVCGGWIAEAEIPESGVATPFHNGGEKITNLIDRLLRSTEQSSSSAVEKVKFFYKTCLDEEKHSQLAVQEALEKMKSLGEFPMLDGTTTNNFSWSHYALFLAKNGQTLQIPNLVAIRQYDSNTSKLILEFSRGSVPFEGIIDWNNGTDSEIYKKRIKKILEMLAGDTKSPGNSQLDKELEDLVTFYGKWIKIQRETKKIKRQFSSFWDQEESELETYVLEGNEEKFSDLVSRFEEKTGLNLRKLLEIETPAIVHDILFDENLMVLGSSPELEDGLVALIRGTPANTWKNFYQLELLESLLPYFPKKYTQLVAEFNKELNGAEMKEVAKWQQCTIMVERFGDAFYAVYARGDSGEEKKKAIGEMIENVRDSFSEIIQESNWLDEETKKNALLKLKSQRIHIGYDDILTDDVELDRVYRDLNFHEEMSYLNLGQEFNRWKKNFDWERSVKPVNSYRWPYPPTTVNAYHNLMRNTIGILLGIMQDPFFVFDAPLALNYGGMGAVIGHEMTHGFDSEGRHFDETGKRRNWWTNSTNEEYERKALLMVEQYNNFEIKEIGMKVNGTLTLGENISDNGAIKESFRAYKKYLEQNGREKKLPGLNFTNEQLFYIGWGRNWCMKATPEKLKESMENSHSPKRARTNVVVSNQPEFAEAFNCPAGSPMNPVKKVAVW